MKIRVLFSFGAVFPLVALAVLTILMPPAGRWAILMGLAVVAGVLSAHIGQELVHFLLSIREEIGEAKKEAKSAQDEANKILAERFERFFEEYGQRDEDWRTKTLSEWQAVKQALDSSFEKMLSDVRSHLATLAEQDRAWQEEALQSRIEAMQAETKQARNEFGRLCQATKEAVDQYAAVIQAMQKTIENIEDHFANQQANILTEWQAVTQGLASSFEKNLAELSDRERVLQEKAAQERNETFELIKDTRKKLNAEFKGVVEELRSLVEEEMQRQREQKCADRDHLEKMLEIQQNAHDQAAERSGQLWGHLLDRLKS